MIIKEVTIRLNCIVVSLISLSIIWGLAIQLHPNFDQDTQELSIPISGGADEPTAIFLTTKVDNSIIAYGLVFLILLLLNTYVIKRKAS